MKRKKWNVLIVILLLLATIIYLYNRALKLKKAEEEYDKRMEEKFAK